METLEQSRVCRLCGKQAGMSIDIFGELGNHVKKINMVLPILVHEMDLLPKHMCHSCNYKLEEFYKFYENCLKTDANLKSQLSWMQRTEARREIIAPMVQINNNIKIKTEPFDYEDGKNTQVVSNDREVNFEENHFNFHEKLVQISDTRCSHCGCYCGNRNYVNDDVSNVFSTNNFDKTNAGVEKIECPSRDLIRRNLFAPEIFGSKDSRDQPKASICDVSKRFFDEQTTNEFHRLAAMDRLRVEKIVDEVAPKMAAISSAVSPRELRPRKVSNRLTGKRSSTVSSKKSARLPSGKHSKASKDETKKDRPLVGVKAEAREEFERHLRPRKQAIYYSDSKRKLAASSADMSKTRIKKILSSVELRKENIKREIDDKIGLAKAVNADSSLSPTIFMLKLKCQDYRKRIESLPNILKTDSNATESIGSRSESKIADVDKTIRNGDSNDKIRSNVKDVKIFVERKSTAKFTNDKITRSSKRKKLHKNYPESTLRLRIEKCDSAANKRISVKRRCSSRLCFGSSGDKKLRSDSKSRLSIIPKYQDCGICKLRFASHELYRLHGCYNNIYHR